jgi:hypothetical protein
MTDDGVKDFWRNDAALWVHSQFERTLKLLAIFFGLLTTASGVYLLGKSADLPTLPAAFLGVLLSALAGASAFSAELYFKGGKAAFDLKAKHKAAIEEQALQSSLAMDALRRDLDNAIAERDEARTACEELKKPKKKRGDRNDVIRRFQRLVDAGKKITPERWSDFKNWESQMIPVVQECFEEHWANELVQPGQDVLRIQSPNEKEKAKHWLTATIAKLQGWIGAMRDGKVDHCIREDFCVDANG